MAELLSNILTMLITYPAIFFCLIGYFNGYLFREPGLYKVIAILFVVPTCIQLLININIVYTATIPFLLSALIGFWGIEETRRNLYIAHDFIQDQMDRFR